MIKQINKEILFLKIMYITFGFLKLVSYTTGLKPEFFHILVISTLIIFIRNKDYFKAMLKGKYIKILLLFMIFVSISTIYNFIVGKISNFEAEIVTMSSILVFIPSILYYDKKTFIKEIKILNYCLIALTTIGSIISIGMYIFKYYAIFGSLSFHTYLEREVGFVKDRLYGIYYNSNFTAGFVGFCATIIQAYIIDWKDKNYRKLKISIIVLSLITNLGYVLLSKSLGSLIVVGITIFSILYFYFIKFIINKQKYNSTKLAKIITRVLLVIFSIVFVIALYDIANFMFNYKKPGFYYDPILDFVVSGNPFVQLLGPLTGRTIIYREIIGRSISHPIFGYGLDGSFPIKLVGEKFAHSHNDFLQIVYGYGYPALISFIAFLTMSLKSIYKKIVVIFYSKKSNKIEVIYFIAFSMIVAFIFRSQIETQTIFDFGIAPMYFWILLSFLLYSKTDKNSILE